MSSTSVSFPRNSAEPMCTVSQPAEPGLWILSMHNTHNGLTDNRLTPDFIKLAMLPALDHIELEFRQAWNKGQKEAALILTGETKQHKFFSNGLQLDLVPDCPGFFRDYYYALMSRILTFPMHVIAAINGHCYAGGFCLMTCCDYRIFKGERAYASMNELIFGAPLPKGMAAVLKTRLPTMSVFDKVMLTAHRFVSSDALKDGIVDEVVPGNDGSKVVERAMQVARERMKFSTSGALSAIKQTLYSDAIEALSHDENMWSPIEQHDERLKVLIAAATTAKL
ncbi:hypothetical protein OIO90_002521 [Microbotryomycetes sp. JL221]|nr:hypothetical protein OIO90_002521 [Microbotryomycetes sp. JL221]